MGKVKKSKGKSGLIKTAVSAVSPRAGKVLELAGRVKGKIAGRGNTSGLHARRGKKGINVNKYLKQVMKAKMNAKLMKIKLSTINLIK